MKKGVQAFDCSEGGIVRRVISRHGDGDCFLKALVKE